MKKIIAIMLAVVLVAGGVGGFVYAVEPANEVHAYFKTKWVYDVPGDTFTNGEVTGRKELPTDIWNEQDGTEAPVSALTLSLDSQLVFDLIEPDPVTMGPPTYEWSLGDVPEGSGADAAVRFWSPDPSPVTFTPGFDASRSANKTEFSAPDTQILTITLTPRQVTERLHIHVSAREDDLVNPVITSPITDEQMGIDLDPDGRRLGIDAEGLEIGTTYTYYVTIEVTPKVSEVKFMPHVIIDWREDLAEGITMGSSVSYTVEQMGTWTWTAVGSYEWHWTEKLTRGVDFKRYSREIVEPVPPIAHVPMTGQKVVGVGQLGHGDHDWGWWTLWSWFRVTNPDCVSEITIERISIIRSNGTVIYEGSLLWQETDEDGEVVSSTPITTLKPHEIRVIVLENYMPDPGDEDHEWMSKEEAKSLPWDVYTVEIFWSCTEDKGLPLIGWAGQTKLKWHNDPGECVESRDRVQMVNMEQVLKPEKEKKVTTLRLQTWFQPEEPFMEPLENFAQAVEDGTKGSVQVELYPEATIWEIAEAVKQGEVEMGLILSGLLQDSPSVMDADWLPFLYNDEDGLMTAVHAGIGDLISDELEPHNITALTWAPWHFSHLFSRDMMLAHPDDVAGLKIRTFPIHGMPGGMWWEAVKAWGAKPITASLAELNELLKDGKVDGAIQRPYGYDAFKLYEGAPYFCVDYAFAMLQGLCINSDVWKSLDKKTKDIITQAAQDFAVEMLATVKDVDEAALQRIEGYEGVTVYELSPAERAIWREASQPVWDGWLDDLGPEGSELRLVGEDIIAIALSYNPLP